jgi:hypothetical protein
MGKEEYLVPGGGQYSVIHPIDGAHLAQLKQQENLFKRAMSQDFLVFFNYQKIRSKAWNSKTDNQENLSKFWNLQLTQCYKES